MRVLVAGASGVLGRALVPQLVAAGHAPIALARSRETMGVENVLADALDPAAVARAVTGAEPDVIVNLLTAIPASINARRMTREFALTSRLRVEGTANLIAAAPGVRLISESVAFAYEPGTTPADEDTPLWARPAGQFRPVLDAVRSLEDQTVRTGGTVLRFGHLYGPGSAYAADGSFVSQIRSRAFPVVGEGAAVFSFIHADDGAAAIVACLDRPVTGPLNVVDDDPAAVGIWLPALAELLGAPPPRHVPVALARVVAGGWGVQFLTRLRGADNSRARAQLAWQPSWASWRQGFAELAG